MIPQNFDIASSLFLIKTILTQVVYLNCYLRYADNTLMAESEGALRTLLMRVKEEWKSWKTQHSKF